MISIYLLLSIPIIVSILLLFFSDPLVGDTLHRVTTTTLRNNSVVKHVARYSHLVTTLHIRNKINRTNALFGEEDNHEQRDSSSLFSSTFSSHGEMNTPVSDLDITLPLPLNPLPLPSRYRRIRRLNADPRSHSPSSSLSEGSMQIKTNSPSQCLHSNETCSVSKLDCSSQAYHLHCLTEPIPVWKADIDKIFCCFSCCYAYWASQFNIDNIRPSLLSSLTPKELAQHNKEEWDNYHQNRLHKVYNFVPNPQFSVLSTNDNLKDVLAKSKHLRSLYAPFSPGNSSGGATLSRISLADLSLTHDRLVKLIVPNDAPISKTSCFKQIDCKRKVLFLPNGVLEPTQVMKKLTSDSHKSRAIKTGDEDRNVLISCFVSKYKGTDSKLTEDIDSKMKDIENVGKTIKCHDTNDVSIDMYDIALKSKYIIHIFAGPGTATDMELALHIPLLSGSIPVLVDVDSDDPIRERKLPILYVSSVKEIKLDELESKYSSEFLQNKDRYSLSSLFKPYWLIRVLPTAETFAHVHRSDKYLEFQSKSLKEISEVLQASKMKNRRVTSHVCESNTTPKPTSSPFHVEIVVPRCCETATGDLAWLPVFLHKNPQITVSVSVYYKCPYCLPKKLVHDWNGVIYSSEKLMKKIKNRGGIKIIDDLPAGVLETPAFDEIINGKEATTYLAHILKRYNTLADMTLFLHSQPTHHMELRLIPRIFTYFVECRHSFDFISLNYRYFGGKWAHEPNDCLMKLIPLLYKDTNITSDKARFPSEWESNYTLDSFMEKEMSGSTAAQFATSKEAIQRRPFAYWDKLMALNNGSINLCGTESSDRWGGDVTGAMERVWHNLFRTGDYIARSKMSNKESMKYRDFPLLLPFRNYDYSLPAYLSALYKESEGHIDETLMTVHSVKSHHAVDHDRKNLHKRRSIGQGASSPININGAGRVHRSHGPIKFHDFVKGPKVGRRSRAY